jgi:hypothetical protein
VQARSFSSPVEDAEQITEYARRLHATLLSGYREFVLGRHFYREQGTDDA